MKREGEGWPNILKNLKKNLYKRILVVAKGVSLQRAEKTKRPSCFCTIARKLSLQNKADLGFQFLGFSLQRGIFSLQGLAYVLPMSNARAAAKKGLAAVATLCLLLY